LGGPGAGGVGGDAGEVSPAGIDFDEEQDSIQVGPVRCESGSLELSLQNEDLMAQRQDLGVAPVTAYDQQSPTCNQKPEQVRHDRRHSRSRHRQRTL
jgi:hypothetical protein